MEQDIINAECFIAWVNQLCLRPFPSTPKEMVIYNAAKRNGILHQCFLTKEETITLYKSIRILDKK